MIDAAGHDPLAEVDAEVAAVGPQVDVPAVRRRDAVLVTGPWLAGVSGVAAALSDRLPGQVFVEPSGLASGEAPTAVVFVVSAAAALTGSDCALLDAAAAGTDVVIGVVSKIDVHRNWCEMLAADRDILAAHAPRYRRVPWVGTAAAPDVGEPRVDDLLAAVRGRIADVGSVPGNRRRNRLRAWESQLQAVARGYDRDVEGAAAQARVCALRAERAGALRQLRLSTSQGRVMLRFQIQQARVQLAHLARQRCASVRCELQDDAAVLSRRDIGGFEARTRGRIDEVVAAVDDEAAAYLAGAALPKIPPGELAGELAAGLPEVDVPALPLHPRRLETRLMMLLGAGFGLGVALTLSRLFADLALGPTVLGVVTGAAVGLVVTVWVVGTRALLQDRAVLDRWVGEATTSLRSAVEQLVATRVLAAESAASTALGEQDETESARVAEGVRAIDSELRHIAVAAARAKASRDRDMPAVQRALDAVRAELLDPQTGGCAAARRT